MKKTIIAAGAAVALAAMPVVSVFAAPTTTTPIVDTLNVNLGYTCSLTRTSGTAAAAQEGVTTATPTYDNGTYTINLSAGKAATIGTTVLTTVCNDTTNGYFVTATFTGLDKGSEDGHPTIPYDSAAVADNASRWNVTNTIANSESDAITGGIVSASGAKILDQSTSKNAVSGATNTLVYKVSTTTTQDAGAYTGSASYTLTYGA